MHLKPLALLLTALLAEPLDVDGLWRYDSIARLGGQEVPIAGLFLFHRGRFVQQSLNVGEPFDQQLAQAHFGSYHTDARELRLITEVRFIVDPTKNPPVDSRRDTEHRVTVERSGEALTLTFGSGTVQKLTRVGAGEGQVILLDRGALALVDGHFLLVAGTADHALAGSGTFERRSGTLQLRAERWFSTRDGRPTYAQARTIDASFDGRALRLPGEPVLHVHK